jgi:hypothetical protein
VARFDCVSGDLADWSVYGALVYWSGNWVDSCLDAVNIMYRVVAFKVDSYGRSCSAIARTDLIERAEAYGYWATGTVELNGCVRAVTYGLHVINPKAHDWTPCSPLMTVLSAHQSTWTMAVQSQALSEGDNDIGLCHNDNEQQDDGPESATPLFSKEWPAWEVQHSPSDP